jgi:hypothetical protein
MQQPKVYTTWLINNTTILVYHNPPHGLWCAHYLMAIKELPEPVKTVCYAPTRDGLFTTMSARLGARYV